MNNGVQSHSQTTLSQNESAESMDTAHTESNEEEEEEDSLPVNSRGDIIQFYNKVFINYVKDFVLRFAPSGDDVQVN